MAKGLKREKQLQEKRARKARKMNNPGYKSNYGKKKAWRAVHCDGVPLPFFPTVMMTPSHKKPWK